METLSAPLDDSDEVATPDANGELSDGVSVLVEVAILTVAVDGVANELAASLADVARLDGASEVSEAGLVDDESVEMRLSLELARSLLGGELGEPPLEGMASLPEAVLSEKPATSDDTEEATSLEATLLPDDMLEAVDPLPVESTEDVSAELAKALLKSSELTLPLELSGDSLGEEYDGVSLDSGVLGESLLHGVLVETVDDAASLPEVSLLVDAIETEGKLLPEPDDSDATLEPGLDDDSPCDDELLDGSLLEWLEDEPLDDGMLDEELAGTLLDSLAEESPELELFDEPLVSEELGDDSLDPDESEEADEAELLEEERSELEADELLGVDGHSGHDGQEALGQHSSTSQLPRWTVKSRPRTVTSRA